ncbi:MAG: DUF1294 domain-containing protein [Clostridia bacterium]|nr:DUF1294 domain-containing protein [Clostridiales bacterium]MDO4353412.1 DUF1294 domain-containing protein [Clostridia bacterium]MDY2910381.1 DUF1294 domain-containing protein [Oscillospiraceae bacterium]
MDAVTIYFLAINIVLFVVMGVDKYRAIRRRWRIPEATLFILALVGGACGGTVGMYSFRHKTKHWYFAVFFPLLALAQLALYFFVYK